MSHPTRRLTLGIFCLFQGLYLLLASGRARTPDEHSAHFMTESLWRQGSTAVPQMVQTGHFYGRIGVDGRPYSPYGPGQPLLAVPYYVVLGAALESIAPASMSLLAREAATSLLSTTAAAGCVVVLFHLALSVGASVRAASLTSVVLGLATPLATYATQSFAEPLLSLLSASALLALARALSSGSATALAMASALAGYAFVTRPFPGAVLMLTVATGWLVERRNRATLREMLALSFPFVVAAAAQLLLNMSRFGNPMQFGYPAHVELGKPVDTFDTPVWIGLYGLLLSPGKGLFVFAAPVLAGLAGLVSLARVRPGLAAAAVAQALASLLFFAHYSFWEGGYCFGPRYLVPLLPALLLPLALAVDRARRHVVAAIVVLVLAGVAVEIVGTSTSFLEDQAGKGAAYYDEHHNYRLDYSLRSQASLLWRYSSSLFTNQAFKEPLGLGLDFWWVFLAKARFRPAAFVFWGAASGVLLAAGSLVSLRALRGPQPQSS